MAILQSMEDRGHSLGGHTQKLEEALSSVTGGDAQAAEKVHEAKAALNGFVQNLTAGAWEVPALAAIMGPKLDQPEVGKDNSGHSRAGSFRDRYKRKEPDNNGHPVNSATNSGHGKIVGASTVLTDGSATAQRKRSQGSDAEVPDADDDNASPLQSGWAVLGVCLVFFLFTCVGAVAYKKLINKDNPGREASLLSGAELGDLAPGFQ